MSAGTFTSGFSRATSSFGLVGATEVGIFSMRSTRPVSSAATITLRTNGDVGEYRSFMRRLSVEGSMRDYSPAQSEYVLPAPDLGESRDGVAGSAHRRLQRRLIGAQERIGGK